MVVLALQRLWSQQKAALMFAHVVYFNLNVGASGENVVTESAMPTS